LPAFANGQRYVSQNGPERERFSDPDATWGHRSAISTRKGGGFYGYKIQAAVCTTTGLPLAWRVETARHHESKFVAPLLDALHARGFHPETCAMDKGYDHTRVYAECEERGCEPVIRSVGRRRISQPCRLLSAGGCSRASRVTLSGSKTSIVAAVAGARPSAGRASRGIAPVGFQMRMRLIVVFGLAATAFAGSTGSAQAPVDALAASRLSNGRCGQWAVPARIAGKSVCLRDNQTCRPRQSAQYRRYGFNCVQGTLVVRWSYLQGRPLVERQLAPGATCPVTTETRQVGGHPGLGRGPAYPIGAHSVITMRLPPPDGYGTEWSGTKRVWLVDQRYTGRILVRGRQLDGPNEVRFVNGRPRWTAEKILNPVRELRFEWYSDYPSLTRVHVPGCYAYQVDGRTFSYLVIFEARVAESE
jgi:DDE family transposase